jgi:hypothetical protein
MNENATDAGRIIDRTLSLMRENAVAMTIAVLALTAVGTIWDFYNPDSWFSLPLSIASMVAQYLLVKQALKREGLLSENLAGAPIAFVGVSILSGLGTVLGLVLLVVPGILLVLRWMPAAVILLAENPIRSSDALGEAWRRTKGHWLAIGIAYLLTLIPFAGAMLAYLWNGVDSPTPLIALAAANLMMNLGTAATWYLGIGVYQGFASRGEELEEIFA